MSIRSTRRSFLQTTGAATLLGSGAFAFLKGLAPVSAADARLDPKLVRLDDSIEPLVRLIEETPRNRLLEEVAGRIKKAQTLAESANKPVALLLCRDLMWEEPA